MSDELPLDAATLAALGAAGAAGDAWNEIRRVMTLAEGDDWEHELPDECDFKTLPLPEGGSIFLVRFPAAGLLYALEPERGHVVEQRHHGGRIHVRTFTPEGVLADETSQPAASDPNLN